MSIHPPRSAKAIVWLLIGLGLAVVAVGIGLIVPRKSSAESKPAIVVQPVRLVPGTKNRLELSPRLIETLGIRGAQVQNAASHERLKLSGSLFLDSNRMVRVHSRFAGEVVSIGSHQPPEAPRSAGKATAQVRPLRLGDHVHKGQLLAIVWSKDVGEKKSDLVNALSKYYLDDAQLRSLKSLGRDVVAQRSVREAERELESDVIEVDRVERTLRSWRLSEAEIKVVRSEAEKIHKGDLAADINVDKSWAEVEVRCPFDGIVLEKNVVAGDIVDTTVDLFKIADLDVLGVMAHVYEEDLPVLESLPQNERRWTVFLKSQSDAPGVAGTFELISSMVDPNQHTAAVMGWLDNKNGRLRAGQFITAAVELPASAGEVVIPDTALVEDGARSLVYVASTPNGCDVTRRIVALASRGQDVAYIRSMPNPTEEAKGCEPLRAGEWVITAGCVELDGALDSELATRPDRDSAQTN